MADETRPVPSATFDPDTREWFRTRLGVQTTVTQCPKCGLFYKPSLGHKLKNCKPKD